MSDVFFRLLHQINGTSRQLAQGALLFERGDKVKNLYALDQGEVRLLRRQPDGAEFILQRATSGAIIAEASLMSVTYHCAAVAITPVKLTSWSCKLIRAHLDESRELAQAYAAHLATEVRLARLRGEIASLRRIADRLDAWLVWHDGELPAKGQWRLVAQEINVTPEALYRELAKRRQGGASSRNAS
ncbi:MAG: Crp/Fnr family transcriptional regulator [Alphaproteobacteria bacterium]|nr:Crp/Fnr family transcriptional regulator [Alphaproteobacteria bacterium]